MIAPSGVKAGLRRAGEGLSCALKLPALASHVLPQCA